MKNINVNIERDLVIRMIDWSEATIEIKKLYLEREAFLNEKNYKKAMTVQSDIQAFEVTLHHWIRNKIKETDA